MAGQEAIQQSIMYVKTFSNPKLHCVCNSEESELVLVIGMLGVQLHINHESLPIKTKNLSECEARGPNLVFSVMTSD